MKNKTIMSLKSVTSLMTSLSKRNDLRKTLLSKGNRPLTSNSNNAHNVNNATNSIAAANRVSGPLSRETVLELVEVSKLIREEVELYNLHALPEDQVDMVVPRGSNNGIEFPQILKAYSFASLISDAVERKYVEADKKLWCNFMAQWSGANKKKLNELRGLNTLFSRSKYFWFNFYYFSFF